MKKGFGFKPQQFKIIHVESRVNYRDQKPMVELHWGKEKGELTPSEAMEYALSIIGAAIAAETDSLLIEFGTKILGLDLLMAALILREFRKFREENPKRLAAWRGQALSILVSAESTESDDFLRSFLEKIQEEEGKEPLDIEKVIEEFQELREQRRSRVSFTE